MKREMVRHACIIAVALGLGWMALPWVAPLGELLPSTKQMVITSRQVLAETKALQTEITAVQVSLAQLDRQERLLAEQEQLMQGALKELSHQDKLVEQARERLREILATERQTAALTAEAAVAGRESIQTVEANGRAITRMTEATKRILTGSSRMDHQMDLLLAQLEGSVDNFGVIGRLKEAASSAKNRVTQFFRRMWEWFTW